MRFTYDRRKIAVPKSAAAKSVPVKSSPQRQLDRLMRKRLAALSGTESTPSRDPVYSLSESFGLSSSFGNLFDMSGRRLAGQLANEDKSESADKKSEPEKTASGETQKSDSDTEFFGKTDFDSHYQPKGNVNPYSQFAGIAFNRGILAEAILRGSGEMMLFTCLKRTVGQSIPAAERQRKLFAASSVHKRVNPASSVIFNRGTVGSSVGLTVNVLRDAGRTVGDLSRLAGGKGALPNGSGAETLRRVYPFLSDENEKMQLREYDEMQKKLADNPEKRDEASIIKSARAKTVAVIAKKSQVKLNFCENLRKMSQSAELAAAMFADDDFVPAMNRALKRKFKFGDEPDAYTPDESLTDDPAKPEQDSENEKL